MTKSKNKQTEIVNERIRTLVEAGSITKFTEVLEMAKLTNVALGVPLHYSTVSRLKNAPGTIKVEMIVALSEFFEMSPQELFQLTLNDLGYKPKPSRP